MDEVRANDGKLLKDVPLYSGDSGSEVDDTEEGDAAESTQVHGAAFPIVSACATNTPLDTPLIRFHI